MLLNTEKVVILCLPQKEDAHSGWHPGMAMLVNISHLLITVNSAINIIVYAIKVQFSLSYIMAYIKVYSCPL